MKYKITIIVDVRSIQVAETIMVDLRQELQENLLELDTEDLVSTTVEPE